MEYTVSEKGLDLSILVVSYNTVRLTLDCIASIRKHVTGLSYEIIMIDNNSQDGTVSLVEKVYPDVLIIKNTENVGFAKANNQGMLISKGDLVLLLNSDTLVCDSAIQDVLTYMAKHKDIGVLSPNLKNMDGSTQSFSCGYFPTLRRLFNQFFLIAPVLGKWGLFQGFNKYTLNTSEYVDWVAGTAMFIKREVIDSIGGLPERFFMYFEDVEFCYLSKKKGFGVYFKHDSSITHLGMGSAQDKTKRLQTKKRWLVNLLDLHERSINDRAQHFLAKTIVLLGLLFRMLVQLPGALFSIKIRDNVFVSAAMVSYFLKGKED